MRKFISQALIFVLAFIAGIVAYGLATGQNMWLWIIGYWVTLTAKNLVDWLGSISKSVDEEISEMLPYAQMLKDSNRMTEIRLDCLEKAVVHLLAERNDPLKTKSKEEDHEN